MRFLLGLGQETHWKVAELLGYDTIWSGMNLIKMFINIYQTTQHSDPRR